MSRGQKLGIPHWVAVSGSQSHVADSSLGQNILLHAIDGAFAASPRSPTDRAPPSIHSLPANGPFQLRAESSSRTSGRMGHGRGRANNDTRRHHHNATDICSKSQTIETAASNIQSSFGL